MSDWRRRSRVIGDRDADKTGGYSTSGVLFQGLIDTASGTNTQAGRLTYTGGERDIPLPMPFDSTRSWIRSIPESGAMALMAYRSDTSDPTFVRYLEDRPDRKLETYEKGYSAYRPLAPGEHEIHSAGFAQSFYGQRPALEQRGGVVRSWLDQDKAEAGQKSPIHTRQLHQHRSNEISDEERFGVVRRPLKGGLSGNSSVFYTYPFPDFSLPGGVPAAFSVASQAIATASEIVAAVTGTFKIRPFAKEYLRIIKNPLAPIPPGTLLDIREGQVFDDDGIQVRGQNGAYLRAKHEYNTTLGDPTKWELDENGNLNWDYSLGATTGLTTNISFGGWILSTGLDIKASTLTNIAFSSLLQTTIDASTNLELNSLVNTKMSTGLNFEHSITGSHKVETTMDSSMKALSVKNEATTTWDLIAGTQANIKAPMVAVGQSPSEPMVMGQQLSTFLQTFLNTFISNAAFFSTGNLGAPTPANPAIISALSQLVGQIPLLTSKTITLAP